MIPIPKLPRRTPRTRATDGFSTIMPPNWHQMTNEEKNAYFDALSPEIKEEIEEERMKILLEYEQAHYK